MARLGRAIYDSERITHRPNLHRHRREGGDPEPRHACCCPWVPACAGMTSRVFSAVGRPRRDLVLPRSGALRVDVDGVERLAGGHEQAVPLRPTEADVAADLRQPYTADQLAFRRPDGHAAISDIAPGIAGDPDIAVDIATRPVGSAFHPIHHAIGEQLAV